MIIYIYIAPYAITMLLYKERINEFKCVKYSLEGSGGRTDSHGASEEDCRFRGHGSERPASKSSE